MAHKLYSTKRFEDILKTWCQEVLSDRSAWRWKRKTIQLDHNLTDPVLKHYWRLVPTGLVLNASVPTPAGTRVVFTIRRARAN